MTIDEFCDEYFRSGGNSDICEAYNKYVEEHGPEGTSFEQFRDIVSTIDTLSGVEEEIINQFLNYYMEVDNNGKK